MAENNIINHSHNGESSTEAIVSEVHQVQTVTDLPQNLAKELMTRIATPANLRAAFKAVKRNKGAPGTDGRTIKDIEVNLNEVIESLSIRLKEGYKPSTVKGVAIPKPDGNERLLGIPTVEDRIVQQTNISNLISYLRPLFL